MITITCRRLIIVNNIIVALIITRWLSVKSTIEANQLPQDNKQSNRQVVLANSLTQSA